MNQYLSDKIKILSFFAIFLVLYIHSGFHSDETLNMHTINYLQDFISGMLGRCAVPLFFVISGYLFFLKIPNGLTSIFEKMKKRIRTLLFPYILSCIFFVAFGVAVELFPGTSRFMNSSVLPLFHKNFGEIVLSIFYGINGKSPMAFQLWFLRDLMILVLFSPVWYYLYKYFKWYWIPVVFALTYLTEPIFPFTSLFWFALGGSFVNTLLFTKRNGTVTGILLPVLFLIISFVQLVYSCSYWQYFQIPVIILGVLSIWLLYDVFFKESFQLNQRGVLLSATSFTFFIYLYHEPTLNIVRKLIVFFIGKNESGMIVSYLLSPWIFIIIAIIIGAGLKRYTPKFYYVLVGGRS